MVEYDARKLVLMLEIACYSYKNHNTEAGRKHIEELIEVIVKEMIS